MPPNEPHPTREGDSLQPLRLETVIRHWVQGVGDGNPLLGCSARWSPVRSATTAGSTRRKHARPLSAKTPTGCCRNCWTWRAATIARLRVNGVFF
jgi:hypothetical protein